MKLRTKDTDKEKISTESLFFLHLLPFFLLHDVVACVFILWVIGGQENRLFISSKTLSHILSLIPLSDFSQERDRKDGFIGALSFMRQHCFLSTWTGRMPDTERLCLSLQPIRRSDVRISCFPSCLLPRVMLFCSIALNYL